MIDTSRWMRRVTWHLALTGLCLTLGVAISACGGPAEPRAVVVLDRVDLPPPDLEGSMPVEHALAMRRSTRSFGSTPLTPRQLSQLLWAAQGENRPGKRTAPSAGGLYPLELYLLDEHGLAHYRPDGHRIERLSRDDLREGLFMAALEQDPVRHAPAVFVIAGVTSRTAQKYGPRAERFVAMEAGHAAQNVLLQAAAMGLGAVPIGGFDDDRVRTTLGLPTQVEPLYLIPVGTPR